MMKAELIDALQVYSAGKIAIPYATSNIDDTLDESIASLESIASNTSTMSLDETTVGTLTNNMESGISTSLGDLPLSNYNSNPLGYLSNPVVESMALSAISAIIDACQDMSIDNISGWFDFSFDSLVNSQKIENAYETMVDKIDKTSSTMIDDAIYKGLDVGYAFSKENASANQFMSYVPEEASSYSNSFSGAIGHDFSNELENGMAKTLDETLISKTNQSIRTNLKKTKTLRQKYEKMKSGVASIASLEYSMFTGPISSGKASTIKQLDDDVNTMTLDKIIANIETKSKNMLKSNLRNQLNANGVINDDNASRLSSSFVDKIDSFATQSNSEEMAIEDAGNSLAKNSTTLKTASVKSGTFNYA